MKKISDFLFMFFRGGCQPSYLSRFWMRVKDKLSWWFWRQWHRWSVDLYHGKHYIGSTYNLTAKASAKLHWQMSTAYDNPASPISAVRSRH